MRRTSFSITLVASALAVLPVVAPALGAQTPTLDRSKAPPVPAAKSLKFPTAQVRTLKNGTSVTVLEDHASPVVRIVAIADVSPTYEPADKTGLSGMVTNMLREGTTTKSADELADAFAQLGNSVSPFGFYTITANVDRSLDLMADQLLRPSFPEAALARLKANTIAGLRRAKENPEYIAGRVFSNAVYGADHAYSRAATEEGTAAMTRDDVVQFYNTYFRPPNIKFVVAGDITPAQAVEKLNRVFGDWTSGKSGLAEIPVPRGVDSTVVYLFDRPGSPQSVIMMGAVGPRRDTPDYFAIQLMNTVLGGAFNSRINLNLREQHQYAYGAGSGFSFRRVPEVSTFMTRTAVKSSKTDSSVIELMKEIRGIRADKPLTADEFAFAKRSATMSMPLEFETIGQRAQAVAGLVSSNLPLDYYDTVVSKFNAVAIDQAQKAAQTYIDPAKLAIVVVGDRKTVEPALRAAGIAPVVIIEKL